MLKFVAMANRKPIRRFNYSNGGMYYNGGLNNPTGILNTPTFDTSTSYNPSGQPGGGMFAGGNTGGGDAGAAMEFAGQLGGGVLDFFQGRKDQKTAAEQKAAAQGKVDDYYSKALSGAYDYDASDISLDKGFEDAYEMSVQKVDTDPYQTAQAAGLEALSNDPRLMLSGVSKVLGTTAAGEQDALNKQLQNQIQGTSNLAEARQGVSDARAEINRSNVDRMFGVASDQMGMYSDAAATAAQNEQQALANKRAGISSAISGGLGLLGETGFVQDMFAEDGMKMPGGGVLNEIMNLKGKLPPVQGPLPGEASHDTNPMHVVDNNGDKHAELMGEEFIINADHANELTAEHRDIKETIESGKTPTQEEWVKFYQIVDSIFSQPQFQDNVA